VPLKAWERFWHAEEDAASLNVFRALFALCVLADVETARAMNASALAGGFHLPYAGAPLSLSRPVYDLLHTAQYPLALLLLLGRLPRAAAAGLAALQGLLLFSDQLNFRNHGYLFWLILCLLAFAPRRERGPATVRRLIQVQLCLVYLYAGLHKLHAGWLSGAVLGDALATWAPESSLPALGAAFAASPALVSSAAVASALFELAFPVLAWLPRARPWLLGAGVLFHAGIGAVMNIPQFSAAMLASYVLFVEPASIRRCLAALPKLRSPRVQ
jgi:hypothetical protein